MTLANSAGRTRDGWGRRTEVVAGAQVNLSGPFRGGVAGSYYLHGCILGAIGRRVSGVAAVVVVDGWR